MRYIMNRIQVLIPLIMVMVLFCSAAGHAAPAKVLKLGYVDPGDPCNSYFHAAAVVFKAWVESNSNGQIEVQLFPNASLGSMREMMEAVQIGSIQSTMCYASVNTIFLPQLNFVFTPYIIPSMDVAWRFLDSPYFRKLLDQMRVKYGMRAILVADDGGFRSFSCKKPIHSPNDMKGLKIRVPESKALLEMVKAMGGTPTIIPWTELYTSLQTGVVDGQECDLPSWINIKLYEVQKHVTLDQHTYSTTVMYINEKWFSALSKDLQNVILEAGRMAQTSMRGTVAVRVALSVEEMKKHGVTVYTPSADEMQQFRELSQKPVIEFMKKEYGAEAFDEFMAAVKQAVPVP